jgi:small-conductance mechanosensitive channel
MQTILSEIQGWLAFLQRPAVLVQLLPVGLLALLLLGLRRPLAPRLATGGLARRLGGLPPAVPMVLGEAAIGLLLHRLGLRFGLVLLLGQITLTWLAVALVEQVLRGWAPPEIQRPLVSRLVRPLVLLAIVLVLLEALGSLDDLATAPLGVWFGGAINLGNLTSVLVVLYVLLVGLPLPAAGLSYLVQHSLGISEGSRRALEQILRYVIVCLGVIWAMDRLGFNQTGVLAIAGGLSVGLGFGIKEVFSNIISGLWLLIEGSVRPGEVLVHQGEVCEVRRLGPRATTLWRRLDNAELVVPNQDFFTTATTTYTRSDRMRRCSLNLAIPRSLSPDRIVVLLQEIAATNPAVLKAPAPRARLVQFGVERYGYSLSFSIADPLLAGAVTAELRLAICGRFRALGMDPPA